MSKHRTRGTRLNRLLSGVLCLALMLSLLPVSGLIPTARAEYWADPYGEQLVEWGVMNPASDLRLSSTITRAEFVAMCNRAFGYTKLGTMPFVDVPSSAWYAQDINIAYNAGYFNGTTTDPARPTASPNDTLTREQAAVLIARNLMLQETVGEVQAFTDSHTLSEWSRGLIGAAVAEGMIGGYEDGSYRPQNNITRGEVAKMLVSVIGTPINKEGKYELGGVYGNLIISSSNVELRNTTIVGNLYVTGGVDLGNVLLENVTVLGRIVISGGGESHAGQSSVVLRNVAADELVIDSMIDHFVTVSAYGITDIPVTHVRSSAFLEDVSSAGYGLQYIELNGDPGTKLQLAGTIKEVVNKTPFSDLQLVQGTAQKITIDEYATNSTLLIDYNTRVDELTLDVATTVTGEGDITDLVIGASGSEVDILPGKVTIRPGITATVNGEEIGSTEAAELSSDPRLLAGYPMVANLKPDEAQAQFAGNKAGVIYWALSELPDGSVSVEHLVNNPAYGGIIYEGNAGNISASARNVYVEQLKKLEPDGSYYLTAMLEDGRGNRSPLKVISFTTPDNTKPEFLNGRISRATCDVVQLTGMANKSCTLHWVLLADGAAAPTAQNFKSGTFGGNYGRGSMSVTKNVPISITVNNNTKLQEKAKYALYVWLNDFDGAQSSQVYKFDVDTPDETPPIVTRIAQTNYELADAIEFNFAINEAPSTLYWAVVVESNQTFIPDDADMNSLAVQIAVENGAKAGAIVSGSRAADGANALTQVEARDFANKLKYETYHTHNFKLYYVAKDAYGNYSEVKYIDIHTKDMEPPIVTLDDRGTVDGKYLADGNIVLIFSEQVTGSTKIDAPTFVDLYNEVLAAEDAGGAAWNDAKKALADELGAHIELWYRAKSVSETDRSLPVVTATPVVTTNPDAYKYGWVNWHEATVVLQPDGRVILTLPAGKALQLGSGMNYYFRFTNIYDDSYDHNRLAVTDDGTVDGTIIDGGGNDDICELSFSTVYATVWLSEDDTGITQIDDMGDPNGLNGTILDKVINVYPQTTSNMADTECWDMVIWSKETPVNFILYRRVDGGPWERVTQDSTETGDASNGVIGGEATIAGGRGDNALTAVSLNRYKSKGYIDGKDIIDDTEYNHAQYETVKDGLVQGYNYQYGIHFTKVGSGASSTDRKSWTSRVKLEISLVAGARGNVANLTADGNTNRIYQEYVYGRGLLTEISSARTEGGDTSTILEVDKPFTDKQPPSFRGTSPTFTATSSKIIMEFTLERPGTVYYVAAPAGDLKMVDGKEVFTQPSIPTTLRDKNGDLVDINAKNDGRNGESYKDNNTYIPEKGLDRSSALKDFIHFVSGEKYSEPTFDDIFNGSSTYAYDMDNIKCGSVPYTASLKSEPIEGLHPDTWYYIYIVLQSDSTLGEVVQIYRVKTTPAQPPTFVLDHPGTTATIQVRDPESTRGDVLYDNPETYYTIVLKAKLPEWFSYKYDWSDPEKDPVEPDDKDYDKAAGSTVLNALISTVQNQKGKTIFDLYAEKFKSPINSTNSLKYEVLNYITRANTEDEIYGTRTPYGPVNSNQVTYQYKPEDMKEGIEYVMLVCARHHDKLPDEIDAYGFAAMQGLFMPDNVPPEFTGKTGIVRLTYSTVRDRSGANVTTKEWEKLPGAQYFTFSGTLTLSFDKPIYVRRSGSLLKVVNQPKTGGTVGNDEISIMDVINAKGFSATTEYNSDGMNFTLRFENIGNEAGFTMNDLCNVTGVSIAPGATKAKQLKVYFNTWLTTKDLNPDDDTIVATIYAPGFEISWQ